MAKHEKVIQYFKAEIDLNKWANPIYVHTSYQHTLNVIGGWLEIGPNYHITVMFDVYNMGQQLDMKFYAKREHPSRSQQL